MWTATPDDCKGLLGVVLMTPLFLASYIFGWDQASARVVFGLAVALMTTVVTTLLNTTGRVPRNVLVLFDHVGWSLFVLGVIVAVFLTPGLNLSNFAWRVISICSQGVLVSGWIILWLVRRRWLARTLARSVVLTLGVDLALFIAFSVWWEDMLITPLFYGGDYSVGIVLSLVIAAVLYSLSVPPWLRYVRKKAAQQ